MKSIFVGNFCPPEPGSGLRTRIRIQGPHRIRILICNTDQSNVMPFLVKKICTIIFIHNLRLVPDPMQWPLSLHKYYGHNIVMQQEILPFKYSPTPWVADRTVRGVVLSPMITNVVRASLHSPFLSMSHTIEGAYRRWFLRSVLYSYSCYTHTVLIIRNIYFQIRLCTTAYIYRGNVLYIL